MALERQNTIEHVTHPSHPLNYFAGTGSKFLCDGCNQPGNGSRYECGTCDFDLHEHCATCPTILSFIIHPTHKLNLVFLSDLAFLHICDVCGSQIEGLQFYRCEICNFVVHPLCTQLPEHTRHPLHPDHLLRLQSLPPRARCCVCETACPSWGYRCQVCDLNIHVPCVNSPKGSNSLSELKRPLTVALVLILAVFVFFLMSRDQQRMWRGYSVHSVYVHH